MITKANFSEEAIKSEAQEKDKGKCEFEKLLEVMRPRPVSFIPISTVSPLENTRHIFVGEAPTVMWATGNSRKYLWGSEFTVLSDFSGLKILFESEANVPHVVHRWISELLQYQFVIWNQTERMMWECDMLPK